MTWLVYSLLSAVLTASSSLTLKYLTRIGSAVVISWLATLCIDIPVLLYLTDFTDLRIILTEHTTHIFATGILNAIGVILVLRAIELEDISYISPILCIFPALSTITATLFLNEHISLLGFVGIGSTTIGVYFVSLQENMNFFAPFKRLFTAPGPRYAVITTILWSISTYFDKVSLRTVHASSWFLGMCIIEVLSILIYFAVKNFPKTLDFNVATFWIFVVFGLSGLFANVFYMKAIAQTTVSYPIALRQLNVLIVLVASTTFLGENISKSKVFGTCCLLCSVLVLAI